MMNVGDYLKDLIKPLYLLLVPYVALLIFLFTLILTIVFTCFKVGRKESKMYFLTVTIAVLSGLFTLFNVYDYIHYRRYGLTRSPINEIWYYLFLSPDDLYNPYKVVSLSSITNEYVIEFKHRYGGRQEVVLNLINNAPKKFDYDNPDKINLKFKTIVKCDDVRVTEDFMRSFTTYFLMPGTNQLTLCRYDIDSIEALSKTYKADIKIDGHLDEFLDKYPGSYLTVRNGTTK